MPDYTVTNEREIYIRGEKNLIFVEQKDVEVKEVADAAAAAAVAVVSSSIIYA